MGIVWFYNRKRYSGITYWLVNLLLHTIGVTLLVLRGLIPDFLSITISNLMVTTGIVLIYHGLERFVGKKSTIIHNYVILAIFTGISVYYTYFEPNLEIRNINFAAVSLILTVQPFWLMVRRVAPGMRQMTLFVGAVFGGYTVISAARLVLFIIYPAQGSDFFKSGLPDTVVVALYIILTAGLAFSLILMVSRRLLGEVTASSNELKAKQELLNQTGSLAKAGG